MYVYTFLQFLLLLQHLKCENIFTLFISIIITIRHTLCCYCGPTHSTLLLNTDNSTPCIHLTITGLAALINQGLHPGIQTMARGAGISDTQGESCKAIEMVLIQNLKHPQHDRRLLLSMNMFPTWIIQFNIRNKTESTTLYILAMILPLHVTIYRYRVLSCTVARQR